MSVWQELMDSAYAKFPDNGTQADMLVACTPAELTAVHLGNLNYQVQNGGFQQWVGNGYAANRVVVRRAVLDVTHDPNTTPEEAEIGRKLARLLARTKKYLGNGIRNRGCFGDYFMSRGAEKAFARRSDEWDTWYYGVDEIWGRAVERHLTNLPVPA